jgi:gamma-glutamyltranspeptidase/glutathione hydrolase
VNYKGYNIWELPPNGQGIAALQMLNMLKHLDLKTMGHNSAEYLHALIEIKKIVYEDRARFYADPDFTKLPVKKLISEKYAKERLVLFDSQRAIRYLPEDAKLEKGDTVYLTVVDKDYNAVSFIQSNYAGFGSGMVPDGVGFCLQNRGALFSLQEDHANVIAPGKRPFHTIIPAMVTKENRPVFSFGVMGGSMQPQGHVQILLNIIEFGMNIQEAGDAARFRHGGSSQPTGSVMRDGGTVYLESGISAQVIRDLLARGHRIEKTRGSFGGYQGIWIDHKRKILIGASESRKDGCAIGF